MEAGFMEADSDNLPKVSVDMVVRFLAASTDMKGTKCSSGETYGDRTIRSVQINRDGGLCTVKCRVAPERTMTSEEYRVTAVIDEGEDLVQSCQCEDCVACPDACKHAAAFLLWLHRRSEEPPADPAVSYWEQPTVPSHDGKSFIKLKDMFPVKKETVVDNSDTSFFDEVLEMLKANNSNAAILRHFRKDKPGLHIHLLGASLGAAGLSSPHAFLQALVKEMTTATDMDCTANKDHSEIWYGRIKDWMLYKAVNDPNSKSSLVDRILGEDFDHDPDDVPRKKRIKQAILKAVSSMEKIQIEEVGLFLNTEYPVLGAAPDGVSDAFTVEIKCPPNEESLLSYVKDSKLTMKLWTQVQAQMYFSKKRKALVCIAQPGFETSQKFGLFHVPIDETAIVSVLDRAQQFWRDSVFPELQRIYNK